MARPSRPSIAARTIAAVAAFFVAVGAAVATPIRRVTGGRGEQRALGAGGGWRFSTLARTQPLPSSAPTGAPVREMPYETLADHPETAVTIPLVISIFREAERGWPRRQCDLIDGLVEGDCTVRNLFEQRSAAVAGKPYAIQEGGGSEEDKAAASALAAALKRLPMIDFYEHQLAFNKYGWAATGVEWGVMLHEGRNWVVPVRLYHVPPRRFRIDPRTNELRLLTAESPSEGEPLEAGRWVVTTRPGPLARAGLMRTGAFNACFKRYAVRDANVYSSKYGLPFVLAQYEDAASGDGSDADDVARQMCADIVKNFGSDGGAVVSKGITVTVIEPKGSGDSSKSHGSVIAYCNAELSRLVNGATLANDNSSGSSSYALGAVHETVRWECVVYDAARLEEAFRTQLSTPFTVFNGSAAAPPILRMQIVKDAAPEARAKVAEAMLDMGGEVSKQQMHEDFGLRAPISDDDRLVRAASAPASEKPPVKLKGVA